MFTFIFVHYFDEDDRTDKTVLCTWDETHPDMDAIIDQHDDSIFFFQTVAPLGDPDHWMEPQAFTLGRPAGEKYCEACGVEIPFHHSRCNFMRNQRSYEPVKCQFCDQRFRPGQQMYDHTSTTHVAELEAQGAVLPRKRS